MTTIQDLPIIDIDLSLRFRAIDPDTTLDYIAALADSVELPEVTVALDQELNVYFMIDGFHRLEAHKHRGATKIRANVITTPKQDALWLALGANAKNGRRLSNEDKRAAIVLALQEFPNASSRVIATHVGCSHSLVLDVKERGNSSNCSSPLFDAEIANEPETASESTEADDESEDEPKRVIGSDGKSYPAEKGEKTSAAPLTEDAERTVQEIEIALYKAFHSLPEALTVEVKEEYLVITSTDPDKPLQRSIPLHKSTDWQNFPAKAFFQFSKGDWALLEDGRVNTVGDLSEVVSGTKEVPKFGKKKLANLEQQFETFWENHPELCQET